MLKLLIALLALRRSFSQDDDDDENELECNSNVCQMEWRGDGFCDTVCNIGPCEYDSKPDGEE
jgi:hypothetical protein